MLGISNQSKGDDCLRQQYCINLFLTVSAVSCPNMNGMIGTQVISSSKEQLSFSEPLVFLHQSLFPAPSCKSKSRLGFNDSHSWSLGQTSIVVKGEGSPLLGSLLLCIILLKWVLAPIQSGPETLGLLLVTPICVSPAHHPSPPQKCNPLLRFVPVVLAQSLLVSQ